MNIFLFYFDKLTAWLNLSWIITPKKKHYDLLLDKEETPTYICDPLLSLN